MTSKRMTKKTKRSPKPKMATTADRHVLYQKSVQSPEFELEFFIDRFEEHRQRKPHLMREDFCGTAFLSTEWCKLDPENKAIGVDLCQDTMDWGVQHNLIPAGEEVSSRVRLLNHDVLTVETDKVDFTCAMNFSFCTFKTRGVLRSYFENVRKGLKSDGILYLDLMGGTQTIDVIEEDREIDDEDFLYVWEQEKFNPITNEILCHIHFDFPDGSRLENAFSYDWRLWSIPELKEIALEAGFKSFHVYWEEFEEDEDSDDEYLDGTGEYSEVFEVDQQESWLAYIVIKV
ncbi:MAG: class I SAM-dependent methyltransferase [Gammaproteobacteria bacterium]|nr:class I SAM-dependent methyltransferase [Gammaproteobacteria bacterium]